MKTLWRSMKGDRLWPGLVAAMLATLAFMGTTSPASGAETINVSIASSVIRGNPGSTVALASTAVSSAHRGKSCNAAIVVTNQISEHQGNTLIVSSGSSQVVVAGVEDSADAVVRAGGSLTLGSSIDVSIRLGPEGISSLGAPTTVTCTLKTVAPTHIAVSCSPDEVEAGGELTVSGVRTSGPHLAQGTEVVVTVAGDRYVRTKIGRNSNFSVSFAVDLPPGAYRWGAQISGATVGRATCAIGRGSPPGTDTPAIVVAPSDGPVCASVTVTGSGYTDRTKPTEVDITFGGRDFADGVPIGADGTFTAKGVVPDDLPAAPAWVVATRGSDPEAEPAAFFVVAGTPPSIKIEPPEAEADENVTVSGSGYEPTDTVDIFVGGQPFASDVSVDTDGNFTVTDRVPELAPGTHEVNVTRGCDAESITGNFIVRPGPSTKVPVLSVTPPAAMVCSAVTVVGSNWAPFGDQENKVDIAFGGKIFASGVLVEPDGSFTVNGDVPIDLSVGPVSVSASRVASSEPPTTVSFNVDSEPKPAITVTPSEADKTDDDTYSVTVAGFNYNSCDTVEISIGGAEFPGVEEVRDGAFEVTADVELFRGVHEVVALRNRSSEADSASFEVKSECWKLFGLCWWWWLLILLILLFILWCFWLLCRRRYPFHPGEEIKGSGWIAGEGKCKMKQGRCVADEDEGCGDGCSCELFRRKMWGSDGCWERVESRQERFTYCYRCSCARPEREGPTQLES